MLHIFIKALPDMISIDVMRTLRSMDLRLIAPTVSRYELQYINRNGISDAYFSLKHYQIWLPLM